jgi:hypothetical protein
MYLSVWSIMFLAAIFAMFCCFNTLFMRTPASALDKIMHFEGAKAKWEWD